MNATPESLIKEYADPIEQQEIDKFICSEMSRQIHRYIKGMSGTKQAMLKFEEKLASLSVTEKEKAIAKYIDLNRKALDGLDLKMILVRSVANYCDTFQYMLDFVNDKRKMVFYYHRLKEKYIRYHEVFEENGKFGMKDHQGNVMLQPVYDFLRTCYIYNDDLSIMPVIAEKNGKMGLVMPATAMASVATRRDWKKSEANSTSPVSVYARFARRVSSSSVKAERSRS